MAGRSPNPKFDVNHLIEALQETRGFVLAAQKYISKKWGYKISKDAIKTAIRDNGMEEWLDDIRKSLVEDCMTKTFAKAIKEGDNACMFWVLGKYKQHIDFLEASENDKPPQAPGTITEFMNLLKTYNADPAPQSQAAPSISAEQRPS